MDAHDAMHFDTKQMKGPTELTCIDWVATTRK